MNWKLFRLKVCSFDPDDPAGPGPVGGPGFGGGSLGSPGGGPDDPGPGGGGFFGGLGGIVDAIESAFSDASSALSSFFGGSPGLTPAAQDLAINLQADKNMFLGEDPVFSDLDIAEIAVQAMMEDPDSFSHSFFGLNPFSLPQKVAGIIGPTTAKAGMFGLMQALDIADPNVIGMALDAAGALGVGGVGALNLTGKATASQIAPDVLATLGISDSKSLVDSILGVVDPPSQGEGQDFGAALGYAGPINFASISPSSFGNIAEYGTQESPISGKTSNLKISPSPADRLYSSMILGGQREKREKEFENLMIPIDMLVNELTY